MTVVEHKIESYGEFSEVDITDIEDILAQIDAFMQQVDETRE